MNKTLIIGLVLVLALLCGAFADELPFKVGKIETKEVKPMSQAEYDAYISKLKASGEYQKLQAARPKRGGCGTMKLYQQHLELKKKQMQERQKQRKLNQDLNMLSNILDK